MSIFSVEFSFPDLGLRNVLQLHSDSTVGDLINIAAVEFNLMSEAIEVSYENTILPSNDKVVSFGVTDGDTIEAFKKKKFSFALDVIDDILHNPKRLTALDNLFQVSGLECVIDASKSQKRIIQGTLPQSIKHVTLIGCECVVTIGETILLPYCFFN